LLGQDEARAKKRINGMTMDHMRHKTGLLEAQEMSSKAGALGDEKTKRLAF
jgi:hypothetical protein